jgi:hypothetical protein
MVPYIITKILRHYRCRVSLHQGESHFVNDIPIRKMVKFEKLKALICLLNVLNEKLCASERAGG